MTDNYRVAWSIAALTLVASCALHGQVSVTTQHNDIGRTGQNTQEVILTPQNVSSGSFGRLFSVSIDGPVYAQPLYLSNVAIPGAGTHNVVYVATEHDSVYALDADQVQAGSPLWQASLLDAAHGAAPGATPEPSSDTGCTDIKPEFGVTGTPVIDPSTGTLYLVSVTSENGYPVQRLHALDVTSGVEKFGGPVVIKATVSGTGVGSSGGILNFDPKWELQRPGLLLVNNTVYISFAAHCDYGPFHGWILGYNATSLAQTAVFNPSPNGFGSGLWMGGAGLAADTSGANPRMFVATGNGTYDASTPYGTNNMDYGDDILQLNLNGGGIQVADAFTPFNQAALSAVDGDVGSGGVLILPDQNGPYSHLAVQAGKSGDIYLVNRENLGGYNTSTNKIVQEVDHQLSGLWGLPAYWNGNLFIWASGGFLKQFTLTNGVLSSAAVTQGTEYSSSLGNTPSVSSNGNTNAIVWAIDPSANPAVLTAHSAQNVATTLYSSASNPARDNAGAPTRFQVPTIANGKVYVAGNGAVSVFGLIPSNDFSLAASPGSVTVLRGGVVSDNITISSLNGFSGALNLTASGLPAGLTAAFAAGSSSSSVLTLTAGAAASLGTFQVTVVGTSGSLTHSVTISVQVLAATTQPDFTLSSSPSTVSLVPGSLATNGIILSPVNGFSSTPSFAISGLPNGVTPTFTVVSATYYILSLSAVASVPLGSYTLTIMGASGSLVHTATLSLIITSSPNFTSVELQPNNTFKCLSAAGGTIAAGASVVQSTCSAATGQLWNLTALGGSLYEIATSSGGFALSVPVAGASQVALSSYVTATTQQWVLQGTPWGFYYVLNANSGQCLDVAGASSADGALVDQAACTGAPNQLWTVFTPVRSTTQVNLTPFFNVNAIVTDGTLPANNGLVGGYALSTSNLGTTASWSGSTFAFGPVNAADAASSNTVALPAGQFSSLQILATGLNGGQIAQSFVVTYTDGSTTTIQQSLSDCAASFGYVGESKAIVMPYIDAPNGTRLSGSFYVYGYSLALNNAKTVQSIKLPSNPLVIVFAMTLVK